MKSGLRDITELESIKLSVRSYNALKRANIDTLEQLLNMTEEELGRIKNLGKKSVEEIAWVINESNAGNIPYSEIKDNIDSLGKRKNFRIIDHLNESDIEVSNISFFNEKVGYVGDMSIDGLDLSLRPYNALFNSGYFSVAEIVNLEFHDFNSIRNLGKKSKEEILDKLKQVTIITYSAEKQDSILGIDKLSEEIIEDFKLSNVDIDISSLKCRIALQVRNLIKSNIINQENLSIGLFNDMVVDKLYDDKFFKDLFQGYIANLVRKHQRSISLNEVRKSFPKHISDSALILDLLDKMETEKIIEKTEYGYRTFYQPLKDYIQEMKDEKNKFILISRLNGMTLEAVSEPLNVTRERIRQKEIKIINKIPRLREDDYKDCFQKYDWNEKLFIYIFEVTSTVYNYLKLKYEIGKIDIKEFLEDNAIPVKTRLRAEAFIYRDYIKVGNVRLKKDRQELLNYVLRTYCKDEVHVDELDELYKMFLEDYDLHTDENFLFTKRYFESTLANSNRVLWKYKKKLRYYNIDDISAEKIVNGLGLDEFVNVEYSTLKFFNDNRDLMEEWDIQDEYELHNLMKKVIGDKNPLNISFLRMPNIEFGKADRDIQVLDLLIQTAPISNVELAKIYENEYGVKSETVLANYFSGINDYYHDGVFSIDYEPLSGNELGVMKEYLTDEVYLISEVKEIYKKHFPHGDLNLINPYSLRSLGFKVTSIFIYSEKYGSLDDYFTKYILKDDIYDGSDYNSRFLCKQSYNKVLQGLKEKFEIIEFSPNKYVNIRRFENIGYAKSDLRNFVQYIKDISNNDIFTIKSLRRKGMEHYLDQLGFDDWFYSSILKASIEFKSRRLEGGSIFRAGKDVVTLNDLVESIVSQYRKIDIYDLVDLLYEEYGVKVDRYKIASIANEKELYYDAVMEKVYMDYDEYFEEV